jgi:hypothetical protein
MLVFSHPFARHAVCGRYTEMSMKGRHRQEIRDIVGMAGFIGGAAAGGKKK